MFHDLELLRHMTCSHKMSLNIWQFEILHDSNLQVLLIILILKSCFYSKQCGHDMLLGSREVILGKSAKL